MTHAWDSSEWRKLRDEKLLAWMNGNVQAVETVIALSSIAETWDDLHDGDKPVESGRISAAFINALVKLQVNEFYKANEAIFYALTVAAINAWMDANELQRSRDAAHRMMAFYLRNFGHEITMMAVFRAGGWEHLRSVSLEIRLFFEHEVFQDWEHRHETT